MRPNTPAAVVAVLLLLLLDGGVDGGAPALDPSTSSSAAVTVAADRHRDDASSPTTAPNEEEAVGPAPPQSSSFGTTTKREESSDRRRCEEAVEDVLRTVRSWQRLREEEEEEEEEENNDGKIQRRRRRRRPFVTLTYAQSLDGCIAVREEEEEKDVNDDEDDKDSEPKERTNRNARKTSSNLILSGPESMALTHGLRSVHDAVLVGSNTLRADNPRLNVRMWPPTTTTTTQPPTSPTTRSRRRRQPRPVALDTDLRALRSLLTDGTGVGEGPRGPRARGLVVCCSRSALERHGDELRRLASASSSTSASSTSASDCDFVLLPCDVLPGGRLDPSDVLRRLRSELGVRSVMVEGGAGVLSSFASWPPSSYSSSTGDADGEGGGKEDEDDHGSLVDCLVVTISPNVIGGRRGVMAFEGLDGGRSRGRRRTTRPPSHERGDSEAEDELKGDDREESPDPNMIGLGGSSSRFVTGMGRDCVFLARWRS